MADLELLKRVQKTQEDVCRQMTQDVCYNRDCHECPFHIEYENPYDVECLLVLWNQAAKHMLSKASEVLGVKELTVDQISELLGYKVKVVGLEDDDE